jgi:hypothetical protein
METMKYGSLALSLGLLLTGSIAACSSKSPGRSPAPPPETGASGGSGGSSPGGSIPGAGAGGTGEAGAGGAPTVDATSGGNEPADGPASGGGSPEGGTAIGGGSVAGWYEAEAIPPNQLSGSTLTVNPPKPRTAKCTPCPSTAAIKPGDSCCSGGGQVTWLTQGIGPIPGGLTFNNIAAPSDGMYDVTWWYHCGNSDNFGDKHCGGQTSPPTTSAGCRPHQIVVNGTEMTGTYHFPCFTGSFAVIHAATTALPLKAGMNSIKVYPKQRDAADMDALQVQPAGKGMPPLIMSNSVVGAN